MLRRIDTLPAIMFALCVFCFPVPCRVGEAIAEPTVNAGEEKKRYDLQTCVDMALVSHPVLKLSRSRLSRARYHLEAKKAEQMPELKFDGQTGYFTGEPITAFAAIRDFTREGVEALRAHGFYYISRVIGDIPLYKGGALFGTTSDAERRIRLEVSRHEWENKDLIAQVSLSVVNAYFDVLKNEKTVETREKLVELPAADYGLAEAEFTRDLISKNDLLIAEVNLAKAKRDLSLSRIALEQTQRRLSSLMGLADEHELDLADIEFPVPELPSLEELTVAIVREHPMLKAQEARVRMVETEINEAANGKLPVVVLHTHYGVANNYERSLNEQYVASVHVEFPIFDFGRADEKISIARAKVGEEKGRLMDYTKNVERTVRDHYFRFMEHLEMMRLLEKQVEQTEEQLKLKTAMHEQELISQTELHDAKKAVLNYRLARAETDYDLKLAYYKLKLLDFRRIYYHYY